MTYQYKTLRVTSVGVVKAGCDNWFPTFPTVRDKVAKTTRENHGR